MSIYWELFYTNGGWFTWALAAVAVGTAVYQGVSANQAKKKAQGAAGAADKANQAALNSQDLFTPPMLPGYEPWNFKSNQKRAIEEDANFFARSDADFRKRHGDIVKSEKLFEAGVLKDQQGEHELMPLLQNEYMTAGLENAAQSLSTGTTGNSSIWAPGGAGEASLATHLGQSIDARQQQNRQNRMASLNMAEEIFPRREFGMPGSEYVASSQADVSNKNAWAAANYEREFAAEQARIGQQQNIANARMTSQNEMAKAQALATAERDKAVASAVNTGLEGVTSAYGSYAKANPGTTSTSKAVMPSSATGVSWRQNARGVAA